MRYEIRATLCFLHVLLHAELSHKRRRIPLRKEDFA